MFPSQDSLTVLQSVRPELHTTTSTFPIGTIPGCKSCHGATKYVVSVSTLALFPGTSLHPYSELKATDSSHAVIGITGAANGESAVWQTGVVVGV